MRTKLAGRIATAMARRKVSLFRMHKNKYTLYFLSSYTVYRVEYVRPVILLR